MAYVATIEPNRASVILAHVESARKAIDRSPLLARIEVETGLAISWRRDLGQTHEATYNMQGGHTQYTYRQGVDAKMTFQHIEVSDMAMASERIAVPLGRIRISVEPDAEPMICCQIPPVEDYDLPSSRFAVRDGQLCRTLKAAELAEPQRFCDATKQFNTKLMVFVRAFCDVTDWMERVRASYSTRRERAQDRAFEGGSDV